MAAIRGDVDVDVRISQRQLDLLVQEGGLVHEYMEEVARDGWRAARGFAPIGSGELFRGLDWEVTTNARSVATASLGTRGVEHAVHYLLGHGPHAPRPNRPIGATLVRRGVPFGNVNRSPGRRYRGVPAMFTSGPVKRWEGNDILSRGMNIALARRGLGQLDVATGIFE